MGPAFRFGGSSGRGEEVRSKEGHTVLAGAGSPGSAARASRRELGGAAGAQQVAQGRPVTPSSYGTAPVVQGRPVTSTGGYPVVQGRPVGASSYSSYSVAVPDLVPSVPHGSQLVVSDSTCPPLSPSPHANPQKSIDYVQRNRNKKAIYRSL